MTNRMIRAFLKQQNVKVIHAKGVVSGEAISEAQNPESAIQHAKRTLVNDLLPHLQPKVQVRPHVDLGDSVTIELRIIPFTLEELEELLEGFRIEVVKQQRAEIRWEDIE